MTRNVAWFHPFSGIAGDMTLGALLDAGADLNFVVATLKQLNIDGWALSAERVERKGIDATRAIVDAPEQHHHRHWSDIRKILESSSLPDRVKTRSLAVFETLAIAEGKVHGIPAEDVHFHEVGALDAIVDIVAHAIGIFICHAFSSTHAQRIELVAFTIAVALRNVGAAAFVNRTRTVAHATSIQGAHAIVDVVTDAIGIVVRCAIASTHAQGVELVALAVAVTV